MASYSHATTVSWGGAALQEIYSCSWSAGGDRQGRATRWIANPGTLTVGCFSVSGLTTGDCGDRRSLSLSGGGASYSGYAILNEISVEHELNGIMRYTLAFTLCDVNP